MRTFKRRGGLADDSSSTSRSLILLFRRRSEIELPFCCSPALAPLCLQHVGRATFSLTHRPAFILLLPMH